MTASGDGYEKIDVTGNDAELQKVIFHQHRKLDELVDSSKQVKQQVDSTISSSEALLRSLGKSLPERRRLIQLDKKPVAQLRSWQEITTEGEAAIPDKVAITDLLSNQEIVSVEQQLMRLRDEFDLQHKLDRLDYGIAGIAGVLASLVDIFLVKMPTTKELLGGSSSQGGTLSDFFKNHLRNKFTGQEIRELEENNWVPYDASTSKNLTEYVTGLGPRSHRFHSIGHDPILGFIFGVKDIICGTMTTIDSKGKFVTQTISGAPVGMSLFDALGRQIGHLKSDIGTPAGLPVPFMSLLGLIQVGSFGEKGRTVGELARTMYAQGYDFGHFLAMSIPVLIIEVIVRTFYFLKRLSEGHGFMQSIPINVPGEPHKPKLQTMLFMAHTIATAANAGKVTFTSNPLAINFPQWIWFFKSAMQQLKWVAWTKEEERFAYVQKKLDCDWENVNDNLLAEWSVFEEPAIMIGQY